LGLPFRELQYVVIPWRKGSIVVGGGDRQLHGVALGFLREIAL